MSTLRGRICKRWKPIALTILLCLATSCGIPLDPDADGFSAEAGDCNNYDPMINPAQPERCDEGNVDENCNGLADDLDPEVDPESLTTVYADQDHDGFGDPSSSIKACDSLEGYVANASDCNDQDAEQNPQEPERCDGLDNDCDGQKDEADAVDQPIWYPDLDGDGFGQETGSVIACDAPEGFSALDTDCDDSDAQSNPDQPELCDGRDNDCDGLPESGEVDEDGDGFRICEAEGESDCDDSNPDIHPGAPEQCDGRDNDCNGGIDDPLEAFDLDDDGTLDCKDDDLDGWTETEGDCDDRNQYTYPAAPEVGDGRDNDCDGSIDEEITDTDEDQDGYQWPTDCDDSNPEISPAAIEMCDGLDNDCDGSSDDASAADAGTWYYDFDHDGFGTEAHALEQCDQPAGYTESSSDCDDNDPAVNPSAEEVCDDGIDNNCNGLIDGYNSLSTQQENNDGGKMKIHTLFVAGLSMALVGISECGNVDADGDGYTEAQGDCDDSNAEIYPDAPELCDEIDNDCDNQIDEDAVDATIWYADLDFDGYGDDNTTLESCAPPPSYSAEGGDCNDADAEIHPGAIEYCDELDNNCDGSIDDFCSDPEEVALCEETGGTWDEGSCGDYICGEPPPILCIVPDPGCDCGKGKIFDEELGCIESSDCEVDQDGDGYTESDGDCDDTNAQVYPGAIEICDEIDNNCDGYIDEICSDPKEVEMCQDTGGTWDPWSCGHYFCGMAPDCDALIPGCDCGSGKIFDSTLGCVESDECTEPPTLCESTGGTWSDCGSGCGPATCDNPDPGPDCPEVCIEQCICQSDSPLWDDSYGCIAVNQCSSTAAP